DPLERRYRPAAGETRARAREQRVVRLFLECHLRGERQAEHQRLAIPRERLRDAVAPRFPPHRRCATAAGEILELDAREPDDVATALAAEHALELVVGALLDAHHDARLLEVRTALGRRQLDAAEQPELLDARARRLGRGRSIGPGQWPGGAFEQPRLGDARTVEARPREAHGRTEAPRQREPASGGGRGP